MAGVGTSRVLRRRGDAEVKYADDEVDVLDGAGGGGGRGQGFCRFLLALES